MSNRIFKEPNKWAIIANGLIIDVEDDMQAGLETVKMYREHFSGTEFMVRAPIPFRYTEEGKPYAQPRYRFTRNKGVRPL